MSIPAAPSVHAAYRKFWGEIRACEICRRDERICGRLRDDYVPLPGPGVLPRDAWFVAALVVGTEPSAGPSCSREEKIARIDAGFVNFGADSDDLALQFALETWLLPAGSGGGYVLTDIAKCAVPGRIAESTRCERFANCGSHLHAEVEMLRPRVILALGKTAERFLRVMRAPAWAPILEIPHHAWRFPRKARAGSMKHVDGDAARKFFASHWESGAHGGREPPRVGVRTRQRLALYHETLTDVGAELRRLGIALGPMG